MKAYKLKARPDSNSGSKRFCESCDEPTEFSELSLYRHAEYDHVYNSDGYTYFDSDCRSVTVWSCDDCGFKTEDEPERSSEETWVCGGCQDEWDNEEDAQECCL